MILINVKISVHYYPHIIELNVQNRQLSKKYISWNAYDRQELYASSYSLLLWVFLSVTFFKYLIKRNLDLTSLEI